MQYPIFIPSKGRPDISGTAHVFNKIGIEDYTLIVEASEAETYANRFGLDRVAVLPREFQEKYDPVDGYGEEFPLGSGPSRNYAWHLASERGAKWHWTMDDNITGFYRHDESGMITVRKGLDFFGDLERYITQWRNVGMGGPQADGFVTYGHQNVRRAVKNTRIYSCNLIRTKLPYRWRSRYNEDTFLSLDLLTNRWCTVLCYQYLMKKAQTQKVKGGNTTHLYRFGTGPKSRLLARAFPRQVEVKYRFGRIHHVINYPKHFGDIPLVLERPKA